MSSDAVCPWFVVRALCYRVGTNTMPALFTFFRGKLIPWSLDYLLKGPVLVKVSARAFLAADCVWPTQVVHNQPVRHFSPVCKVRIGQHFGGNISPAYR